MSVSLSKVSVMRRFISGLSVSLLVAASLLPVVAQAQALSAPELIVNGQSVTRLVVGQQFKIRLSATGVSSGVGFSIYRSTNPSSVGAFVMHEALPPGNPPARDYPLPSDMRSGDALTVPAGVDFLTQSTAGTFYYFGCLQQGGRFDAGRIAMSCRFTVVTVEGDTQPTAGAAPSTQTWIANLPVDLTVPAAMGGNTPVSYALSPALPTGLTFDPMTRRITGTPSTASALATYTMTATDFNGDTATVQFEGTVPPEAPVTISPTALTVNENTSAMYTVVLDSDPGTDVTVTPGVADDGGQVTFEPAALTFSATNWNTAQQITVVVGGDSNTDNEAVVVIHTATGGATGSALLNLTINDMSPDFGSVTAPDVTLGAGTLYDTLSALRLPAASAGSAVVSYTLTPPIPGMTLDRQSRDWVGTPSTVADAVTVIYTATDEDGDTASLEFEVTVAAGVTLTPTALTVDEGAARTYTIRLGIAPRTVMNSDTDAGSAVMITPNSDNDDVTFAPAALTFGATDWNTAQTVTVTAAAIGDPDADDATATISHTVAATQGNYRNINTADPVSVTVTDPDVAGVTIDSTSVTVDEGDAVTYTAVLATDPGADVTLTLSSNNPDVTVPGALTFAAETWNTAQTVTVTAAEDNLEYANDTATISHVVSGYPGVTSVPDVVVTVTDNDTDTVPAFGTATVADRTYTAASAIETLTLPEAIDGNGALSYALTGGLPDGLSFDADMRTLAGTPTTEAAAVTLTYTVADTDANTEAADEATLTFAVTVTPAPGVILTPTAFTVAEGATLTYTVVLATNPGAGVTLTLSSGNLDVTVPGALTFAAETWNTAQTVTVTAAEDNLEDFANDTATISHMVSGYPGVASVPDVVVTVTDNDTDAVPAFGTATVADRTYTAASAIETLTLPEATGGNGDLNYALTGGLPDGLSFDADTRTLAGTPTTEAAAVTLTYTVADADASTGAADEATLTFAVTVTTAPGVTLTPTALTVAEGAMTTYTVELTTLPTGDVTVTPATTQSSVITLSGALTFSTTTWNTAQTVTVTAPTDTDATDSTATITHAVGGYGDVITAGEVMVTVEDSQSPRVTLTPTALNVAEGATITYAVELATAPTGDVTVTPGTTPSSVLTLSGALTFSTTTWNTAQTVTVTATDDEDTNDATATITHAVSGYGTLTTAGEVTVTVEDTDVAGVTIAPTALMVGEGNMATYTVVLATLPGSNVTVTLTVADGVAVASPALTFAAASWDTAQTVTVTATDDGDADDATATITHAVSGYGDVTMAADVVVTVTDDEVADTVPAFGTATVADRTYAAASAIETLTLPEATGGNGALSYALTGGLPDGLGFDADTRTLAGTPTTVAAAVTLTYTVADADASTGAADEATLTFAVTVTTAPGVTLTPTALTVAEGAMTTYTVELTTLPTGDVTVTPATTQSSVITLSGALTFSPTTWNTAQTVTVTAPTDTDATDSTATITHAVGGYGDVITAGEVMVTVEGSQSPRVTLTPTALSVAEGATITYAVELATAPTGDVTVTPGTTPSSVLTLSGALTFSTTTWNTAQTVTVTATDDEDTNDATATITHAVSGYGTLTTAGEVTVTVENTDVAGVTIAPTALMVGEGNMATYTVVLATLPGSNVTVTLTVADGVAVASPALTFAAASWDTAQTVTVTATDDGDADDATATITHAVSGYGDVTMAADVVVTVTDDEVADTVPAFGTATVADRTYTAASAIETLTLPEATGGNGALTYALTGDLPDGLGFDADTRTLAGTPTTEAAAVTLTYTVADADASTGAADETTLTFAVTVTPAPGVTLTPTALTVDEGAVATYTVELTTLPTGDVTVTPDTTQSSVITLSGALTFSTTTWNTAQTVTVTASTDLDATDATATITHAVGGYNGVTAGEVMVTVDDSQSPRVTLTPTALSVAEGATITYAVELATAPTGDVTVTPGTTPSSVLTLSGALTFSTTTWNTAQTVTVTATDDEDTNDATATITHAVSGYGTLTTAGEVTVTVENTDVAGVTIAPTALMVGEGNMATYTVVLATLPGSNVTVTLTVADGVAVASPALTFAAASWDTAQTVTVTATDDGDADDATATITHAVSGYGDVTMAADVVVTVTDDEVADTVPAFGTATVADRTYTAASAIETLTLPEATGGNGALTYALTGDLPDGLGFDADTRTLAGTPTTEAAAVTLTYTVADADASTGAADETTLTFAVTVTPAPGVTLTPTALTVDEGAVATYTVELTTLPTGDVTVTPDTTQSSVITLSGALTFSTTTWNTAQTVTVTASTDLDATDATATITHAVGGYNGVTAGEVMVTVEDSQSPRVTLTPTALSVAEGATITYAVELATAPTGDVTVTPGTTPSSVLTLSGALTFSTTTWNTAQTVTVTATDDEDADDATATITHAVSGYGTLTTAGEVTVTVEDTDVAGVTIAPTALTVGEGTTATYTVVLATLPGSNVTVTPTVAGGGVSVSPVLTFVAASWDTAQTVTVIAADDGDADDATATITHAVSGYGDVTMAAEVVVTVTDDEVADTAPAFSTATVADRTYTAASAIETLTLPEATGGNGDLTYALTGGLPDGLSFDADTRTLAGTPTTEAAAVTLTYTVADADASTGAADEATLTFAVTVTTAPGVTLTPTALTVAEGAMTTYTVELTTLPTGDVTVTPDTTQSSVITLSGALTFSTTTWNTAQTVTVTASTDLDANDATATITHAVGGYNGVTVGEVMVTVEDSQSPRVTLTPTALSVAEGATITYAVELATAPTGDVTVTPAPTPSSGITLSGALTFSTTTWNTAQTVTVTATDDEDADDATATITHAVSGYGTLTTAGEVTVTVEDTDVAGVTIAPTALTVGEGTTATYTVVLATLPGSNVTVTPTVAGGGVSVSPVLTFVAASWDTAQTVTVIAADDGDADDATATITHAVSGYGDVTMAAEVVVTVTDDEVADTAPAFSTATVADRTYTAASAIETLTLPEATGGNGDLTYALTGGLPDGLSFDADTRTLAGTPTTEAAAVTLTYTVADADASTGAADEATLTFAVTVTTAPGVTLTPTALTVAEGAMTTYTVELTTLPTGDVTVTPDTTQSSVITLSGALTFSTTTWNTAQTVTVTASTDLDANDATATITHAVGGYNGVTAGEVMVTVEDSQSPRVTLTPTALSVAEGATITYAVELATAPTGDVTVTPAPTPSSGITLSGALTFSTTTWNTAQTVTVTAGTDDDATATITHAVSGYGTLTTAGEVTVEVNVPACGRTSSVQAAIVEAIDGVSTCGEVTANALRGVTELVLSTMRIGTLESNDFAELGGLRRLDLRDNMIATLPEGIFDGLGALNELHLAGNLGSPFSLTIDLEQLENGQFRARIMEATPLQVEMTWTFAGGAAGSGGVAVATDHTGTATIPAGQRTSQPFGIPGSTPVPPTLRDPMFTGVDESTADTIGSYTGFQLQLAPPAVGFGARMVADQVYTINEAIEPLALPAAAGGDGSLSYDLTPAAAIPAGLSLDRATRTLSGTPTTVTPAVELTWTVTDTNMERGGDKASLTFRVTVDEGARMDDLNRVILPEVARALADNQVSAIARRIRQADGAASGSTAGSLSLGGQSTLAGMLTTHGRAYMEGTLDVKSMLGGSDFVLPLHASGTGRSAGLSGVTLWGGGDYRALSGNGDAVDWEGDLFSAYLGADTRLGDDLLAGVSVSWSEVGLDYDYATDSGDYDLNLTSVHPYLGWTGLEGRLDVWATVGYGWGELEISNDTALTPANRQSSSDVTMQTVGAGGSAQVLEGSAATVRLKGEALQTIMDVEGNAGISALKVEARRLRVSLEASRTHQLATGGQLIPTLEVGMRHDAGDGRTGTGAEVGGGVRYTDAAHGLTIESHGRVLLGHGGGYKDWGVGGSVRLAAGQDGHGLSFSLQPTWGATASRVAQVWAQEAAATVSSASRPRDGRVDLNVGYGLGWADTLVTPYGQLTLTNGQTRAYRLGSRMRLGGGMSLNLEGTRQETAAQPVDHGVLLQIGLSF